MLFAMGLTVYGVNARTNNNFIFILRQNNYNVGPGLLLWYHI